jgi:hypothetical protein
MTAVRKPLLFGIAALGLLAGSSAEAVLASYSLVFGEGIPPVTISGTGVGTTSGPASFPIPAGVFAGNPKLVFPISPTFVWLTAVTIPANSVNNPAVNLAPGGAMGLSGRMFFKSLGGTGGGSIPIFPIGGGGTAMGDIQELPVKIVGGVWQYSANKVFTGMGALLSNNVSATATAFDNRTGASGQGTVQLVAPAYALISPPSLGGNLPLFGVLTLTYLPEPGTLLLLASGVAALGAIGRSRREKG